VRKKVALNLENEVFMFIVKIWNLQADLRPDNLEKVSSDLTLSLQKIEEVCDIPAKAILLLFPESSTSREIKRMRPIYVEVESFRAFQAKSDHLAEQMAKNIGLCLVQYIEFDFSVSLKFNIGDTGEWWSGMKPAYCDNCGHELIRADGVCSNCEMAC
jgi:hypothetical protein